MLRDRRLVTAIVSALVVLGAAARLRQYLGRPSYWVDESYTLLTVFNRSFAELAAPREWYQIQPPGFLWVLRSLYLLAGASELAMRLPALLASLIAVALMVPLARRYVRFPSWPWAVALCAVSQHGLTHAYEAKPYALDLVITQLVLLAVFPALQRDDPGRAARFPSALFALALLAPLLSFPSLFVLGAASLALLMRAIGRGGGWAAWAAFNGVLLISAGLLAIALRGADPTVQQNYFMHCFPDLTSAAGALRWGAAQLVQVGHYGTTGMGVPLLLLAVPGIAALWRGALPMAVVLVAPIALAMAAAALHRYPFCDRLLFFAVPCVWLAATAGIGVVAECLGPRQAWATAALLAVLLLPGSARMVRALGAPQPRTAFRDAFDHVRARWQPGDALWIGSPEVFELYTGTRAGVLSPGTPPDLVEDAARRGRLWVIDYPPSPGGQSLHSRYATLRGEPAEQQSLQGLDVYLFVSPAPPVTP